MPTGALGRWRAGGWNRMQALKRLRLPAEKSPKRMGRLIRHWLRMPVELKREARQLKACLDALAGWVAWWRGVWEEGSRGCRVWEAGVEAAGACLGADGGAPQSLPEGSKLPTEDDRRPLPGPEQSPTKVGKDSGGAYLTEFFGRQGR